MTSRTHPKPESSRGSKKINTLEGAANRMGKDQRQAPLSSWKFIRQCKAAEEAEILACCEGLKMRVELEMDCAMVATRLTSKVQDRSQWSFQIREASASNGNSSDGACAS
uniref:Uncharacterized protein n=1 Tax=Oryza rufipogon TaxID=4529 RepID=A0A0E0R1X3_ORYRU